MTENVKNPSKLMLGFGYRKWMKDLTTVSAEKGLSSYLGIEGFKPARAPFLHRTTIAKFDDPEETITADELRQYQTWVKLSQEHEDKCARALSFIRQMLSPEAQLSVERYVSNPEVPSLTTIERIFSHLKKECGGQWTALAERLSNEALHACPLFHTVKDFDNAMEMLKNLMEERRAWSMEQTKTTTKTSVNTKFDIIFDTHTSTTEFIGSVPRESVTDGSKGYYKEDSQQEDMEEGRKEPVTLRESTSSRSSRREEDMEEGRREPVASRESTSSRSSQRDRLVQRSLDTGSTRRVDRTFAESTLLLWLTERIVREDMKELGTRLEDEFITFPEAVKLVVNKFDAIRKQQQRELMRATAAQVPQQVAPRQSESQEFAFAARSITPTSEKRCFRCNKLGHVIRDCTSKVNISPESRSKIRCGRCMGIGHYSSSCPTPYKFTLPDESRRSGSDALHVTKKRLNKFVMIKAGSKRVKVERDLLPKIQEAAEYQRTRADAVAQQCIEEAEDSEDMSEHDIGDDMEQALMREFGEDA